MEDGAYRDSIMVVFCHLLWVEIVSRHAIAQT